MKVAVLPGWWKRFPILLRGQLVIRIFRGPVRVIEDVNNGPYMTSSRITNLGIVSRRRFLVLGVESHDDAKRVVMERGWLGTEALDVDVNATFTEHRSFTFPPVHAFPGDKVQFREAFE